MAEEPSLSYYLPIAGGRIIGFIPFPRVLVLCEMQSVSSRIWTRIAVFISYGDNDYTTGTEGVLYIPQSSRTGTSTSDGLVSYAGHSLDGEGLTPVQRWSRCILLPEPTGLLKLQCT